VTELALPAAPFSLSYAPPSAARRDDPHLLAAISFGNEYWIDPADARFFQVGLPELVKSPLSPPFSKGEMNGLENFPLANATVGVSPPLTKGGTGEFEAPIIELWRTPEAIESGQDGAIFYRRADSLLFAQALLPESGEIETQTRDLYRHIVEFTRHLGYPALLRVWHYFSGITAPAGDSSGESSQDRYQAFCVGRHQVLSNIPGFEQTLPAATVIGSAAPGLLVYFLAAREPGRQIENPRQISAFCYPPQYAPKSPAFSRASLKSWGVARHLYISGTASIVGHASRHPYEVAAQVDEILENIRALLIQAGSDPAQPFKRLRLLKVYLRRAASYPQARQRLIAALGQDVPMLYLQGDICRPELEVEIEGVG
jgi:chorismate lyase/3-hydroxybenzoate synthase